MESLIDNIDNFIDIFPSLKVIENDGVYSLYNNDISIKIERIFGDEHDFEYLMYDISSIKTILSMIKWRLQLENLEKQNESEVTKCYRAYKNSPEEMKEIYFLYRGVDYLVVTGYFLEGMYLKYKQNKKDVEEIDVDKILFWWYK